MKLSEILSSGANVTIAVDALTLKEFMYEFMEEVEARKQKELEQKNDDTETYVTAKEARELLGVCHTTLWRWEKEQYIVPFRIGVKVRYRLSDIKNLMQGNMPTA
ncbi:MAG: helix-turn-helix domain-containing protein [Akkermansia sp.]